MLDGAIVKYLADRVPRYTSYPTAPHFTPSVDGNVYGAWLEALPAEARLSLYLHVPFCQSLCWYCGCHTKVVRHREPIERYAASLEAEIKLVAARLGAGRRVVRVHWGGGTPTILGREAFARVMASLRRHFDFVEDAEIAVEIDPRRLEPETAAALAACGVNRASLGVQSFDPAVQRAVNRVQSFEVTRDAVAALRRAGIARINVDLLYGLPHETVASCRATIAAVLALSPDRIAVFGYAHVPALKRHQQRLDAAALPGSLERWDQEEAIAASLVETGYLRIGLDHYARPGDALANALAQGRLKRNFQGYTDDPAEALLGLGASAISELPQGYVQNAASLSAWSEAIAAGRFATARGVAFQGEDRIRREVIERLMCDAAVDLAAVAARHGAAPEMFKDALAALAPLAREGIVRINGTRIAVPEAARCMLRKVASAFDVYLDPVAGRHAIAV